MARPHADVQFLGIIWKTRHFSQRLSRGEIHRETVEFDTGWMVRSISMVSKKVSAATPLRIAAILPLIFVALVRGSGTPPPSPAPSAPDVQREAAAERYVNQELQIWQERLDLKDWKIEVALVRPAKLEPKTLGNIHWDLNTKQATISVLSAYDYTLPTQPMLDDMEFTVVHELIHLHLASLPKTDASRPLEEHAVNEIARALLRLVKH